MKRLLLIIPFLSCVIMHHAQIASNATIQSWDKKIDSLQKLIPMQNNDTGKANSLFALGVLYDKKENHDEVLRLSIELMRLSKQLSYKSGTGLAILLISNYYYKKKNYEEAYKNIFIALDLLKQTGPSYGLAICYDNIYKLNLGLGKSDLGITYLDSAMLIWQRLGNDKEVADLYVAKGTLLTMLEKNGTALECQYMALNIYEKLNDQAGIANALGSIGYAYLGSNDDSLAAEYLIKALSISKKSNDKFIYADDIMTLGDARLKQGKYSEAKEYYTEGFKIFHLPGAKKAGLAWSYSCFARVYDSIGDSATLAGDLVIANANYNDAFQNFSLALTDYETLRLSWVIAEVKISLGAVSYKLGKYKLAKKYLYEGLEGFMNIQANTNLAIAYLYLSKIDSIEGNVSDAYKHFKLYSFYKEKSLNSENDKTVAIFKVRERIEQKENEIKQLAIENKLKTALAQKQKQQKSFAYGIVALIALSGVFGFYRYRRFSHSKSEKKLLRDRLQISQDLHDHVGSTLSSISVYSKVAQKQGEQNNQEELQTVLNRISETSGEMVSDMNDIVWAINPKNDSMEKVILRMESYAKPMLATRNIRFSLDYDPAILVTHLDMEKRKNVYLIFKEVINNAFKYSGCSEIHTTIISSDHQLLLTIIDNGVGFDVKKETEGDKLSLSGNGLRNMRSRVEEMKGYLQVKSKPGEGTEINLRIPIP